MCINGFVHDDVDRKVLFVELDDLSSSYGDVLLVYCNIDGCVSMYLNIYINIVYSLEIVRF